MLKHNLHEFVNGLLAVSNNSWSAILSCQSTEKQRRVGNVPHVFQRVATYLR